MDVDLKIHGLSLGDPITIIAKGKAQRAFVWSRGQDELVCFVHKHDTDAAKLVVFEKRAWPDEGKTWCRGWKGSAVDAMKTVHALESTT